jgi:hypothetical protein
MNINLINEGYTERHYETVRNRYGTTEIFEVYSPSGRFVGYQLYRNHGPKYAPFKTLKGARVSAGRVIL